VSVMESRAKAQQRVAQLAAKDRFARAMGVTLVDGGPGFARVAMTDPAPKRVNISPAWARETPVRRDNAGRLGPSSEKMLPSMNMVAMHAGTASLARRPLPPAAPLPGPPIAWLMGHEYITPPWPVLAARRIPRESKSGLTRGSPPRLAWVSRSPGACAPATHPANPGCTGRYASKLRSPRPDIWNYCRIPCPFRGCVPQRSLRLSCCRGALKIAGASTRRWRLASARAGG